MCAGLFLPALAAPALAQQVNPLAAVKPALQKKLLRDQYPEAIADLNQLLKADSLNPDYLFLRAECYMHQKQLPAALADFNKASRVRPNQPLILMERGVAKMQLKQFPAALADFDQAKLYDPKMEPLLLYSGYCRIFTNDLLRAQQDLTAAAATYNVRFDSWLFRGIALMVAGNYRDAIGSCTEQIRRQPKQPLGYANRALAYLATGEAAKAQADMELARKYPALDPESQQEIRLIEVFVREKTAGSQPQPALYEPLLAAAPDKAELYLQRGDLHLQTGDLPGATADWQQAASLGNAEAAYRLSVGYKAVK